jgi:hypothetical protein
VASKACWVLPCECFYVVALVEYAASVQTVGVLIGVFFGIDSSNSNSAIPVGAFHLSLSETEPSPLRVFPNLV